MSTKQDKFYETLRQTQTNTFSDGLNMDLHPLTTPNTILTDCVNGTMITYNDNEFVLQNDRGNTKIEGAKLNPGFIPVGMKEHNGILYIVSHNPQTKESEIGTYPSPNKEQEHGVNIIFEGNGEIKSNYKDFDQSIKYYDYNTIVTNQDNYTFSSSHNPLIVLEHFILNKTGEVTKTKLVDTDGTNTYRFTHEGEGILGYKYRPYYLSNITPSIIPSKGGSDVQLVIEATSDDKELYEVLKTEDDIKFKYDIVIEFVNGENKLEFKSESLNIDKWDYTFNLTNVSKLSLQFENKFTIENENGNITCEYNYRTGELITTKTIDDNTVEIKYKEVNFNITPCIYTSDDNYITYDNLIIDYKTTMDVVFKQESWFTTFKYKPQDDGSNKLSIWATLDLSRFDIDWKTNVQTINESSYKLYEIDKYGNIKGKYVNEPVIAYKSPLFDVVDNKLNKKSHDLVFNDKQYNFSLSYIETLVPIQYSNRATSQCMNLGSENKASYVRYDKIDEKTYNIVLLNENKEEISSTNIYSDEMCSDDMKKMIDEYFDKTNGEVNYTINDVPFEYNKIYLLELTFPINGKINKASFIVVTAESMFDKYDEYTLNQRMDAIPLSDWFIPEVDIIYNDPIRSDYRNPSSFVNNLIDVEKIKNMPTDDNGESAKKYAMQFFLKYNQLFTNPNDNEIPAIGEQFKCTATIINKSQFECIIDNGLTLKESTNEVNLTYKHEIHLVVDESSSEYSDQTSERIYFYDQLYNKPISIESLDVGMYVQSTNYDYEGCYLANPDGNYLLQVNFRNEDLFGTIQYPNWLDSANIIGYKRDPSGFPWYYLIENSSHDYGATAQVIQKLGFNGLMQLGKVSTRNRISYSGNKEKIWIYCISQDGKYVLGGINLPTDGKTFKEIWECILKHAYYTKKINKKVFQYVFNKEDDSTCKITEFIPNLDDVLCKIYPSHTLAIYSDYSEYNVQNWNNLNTYNIQNNITVKPSEYNISWNELTPNTNYTYFLNTLGCLINNNKISEKLLNQYNDTLQFDTNEELYVNNIIDIYSKKLNTIKWPILQYDVDKNILYTELFDKIDKFDAFNWKWNYSCEFNEFWNISKDNLNDLNKYHSLLFYKLTTYNGEQQS